jgi:hypothetical protein
VERLKGLVARFAVAAISMIMLVSMTAGSASAVAATNTVKGAVTALAYAANAAPSLTWAGVSITLDLSIDTDGAGTQQFWLFNDDGGDCSLSGTVITISGAADCEVLGRVGPDGTLTASTDEMAITIAKGTQAAPTHAAVSAADYGDTFSLSATGGSGTGAYTYDKVSGDCTVSSAGAVAITSLSTPPADCVFRVKRAADSNWEESDWSSNVTITVGKDDQATLFTEVDLVGDVGVSWSGSALGVAGQVFNLRATGGTTAGAITYSKVGSGDCTVNSGAATVTIDTLSTPAVECVVRASMAGTANYNAVTDDLTISLAALPTTSVSPRIRTSGLMAVVFNPGVWSANGGELSAVSYQWYKCSSSKSAVSAASTASVPGDCTAVSGATGRTWRVAGVTENHIRVLITRSNESGTAYAWSATVNRP